MCIQLWEQTPWIPRHSLLLLLTLRGISHELVMSQLANVRTTREVKEGIGTVREASVAVSHDQGCDWLINRNLKKVYTFYTLKKKKKQDVHRDPAVHQMCAGCV